MLAPLLAGGRRDNIFIGLRARQPAISDLDTARCSGTDKRRGVAPNVGHRLFGAGAGACRAAQSIRNWLKSIVGERARRRPLSLGDHLGRIAAPTGNLVPPGLTPRPAR